MTKSTLILCAFLRFPCLLYILKDLDHAEAKLANLVKLWIDYHINQFDP